MENATNTSSYKQIVKATGIFGGSQLINIVIGVIRNKVIALLLGASGVGVLGIYQSIVDVIRSMSGLGMEMTGVKEVAEVEATNDQRKISLTVFLVRRLIQWTALLGALICLVLSYPISVWAFDDTSHTPYIAALALVIFTATLYQGQFIILQGLRQIMTMAKVQVLANFISLLSTLPFYFLWGLNGILPAMIVGAVIYYLVSLRYYNPVNQSLERLQIRPKLSDVTEKGRKLFKVGIYLVLATIVNTLTMFMIRAFLVQKINVDAAGLFQSVWAITNVYLMLILKAMGTDFYPRLCAINQDNEESSNLINQQTLVAILVATPIIIGMLLFGMTALKLLYSSKFIEAESLLQWQILGTFLKVVAWPMAFILLAKNKGKHFLLSEILFFVVYYGCNWLLFSRFGLDAAGIAYLIAYVVYLIVIYFFSVILIRFNWTRKIWLQNLVCTFFVLGAFLLVRNVSGSLFYVVAIILFLVTCGYALWQFNKVLPLKEVWERMISKK